jgi:hypothetical protein
LRIGGGRDPHPPGRLCTKRAARRRKPAIARLRGPGKASAPSEVAEQPLVGRLEMVGGEGEVAVIIGE